LAASMVLVTAEEIVPEEDIRRRPDRTIVPGFAVDAVVPAPFGSYPHECYGLYDSEPAHFTEYVSIIHADGPAGLARYLHRYVYEPATHTEYLALFGERTLTDARRRAG